MTILLLIAIVICTAIGFVGGMVVCNYFKWKSINGVLAEMDRMGKILKKANKRMVKKP